MTGFDHATHLPTPPIAGRLLQWLFISLVAALFLSLAAAHAPSRIKLLCLFSVAYGLASGAVIGWLARRLQIGSRPTILGGTAFVALAGLIALTLESHRLHALDLRATYGDISPAALMQHAPPPTDAEARARYDEFLAELQRERREKLDQLTSFTSYLKQRLSPLNRLFHRTLRRLGFTSDLIQRLSPLGGWPAPWPEIFWGIELLLSSAAAAWIGLRVATSLETAPMDGNKPLQ